MAFAGVNYLAVTAAAVASFLLGWIWYGVVFQKQWMAAIGKSSAQLDGQKSAPALMVITLICLYVMALMLAGMMGHLGAAAYTALSGMAAGASVWLGFVITTMIVNHGFGGAKPALTLIDGGHWLAVLVLQGAILGAFGV